MVGFITTRSLLANPSLIVREFGMHCFVRCMWRTLTLDRNVTFLECIPFPAAERCSRKSTGHDGRDPRATDERGRSLAC
jgi:hypothetical protein